MTASHHHRTARRAGLFYLGMVLIGPFVLLYVPGKILVPGDASATAANILAHQDLYRAAIAAGILGEICMVAAVLYLYRLLRDVGPDLALAMVALILVVVPLAFLRLANDVATLKFVRGGEFLAVFDKPQRDALALLLLQADKAGTLVSQVFWGLWLMPLGLLVYRSGFLPRWLGLWLVVNGVTYVALSAIGLWWPAHAGMAINLATPALLGEVALTVWLLIMGGRLPPPGAAGAAN